MRFNRREFFVILTAFVGSAFIGVAQSKEQAWARAQIDELRHLIEKRILPIPGGERNLRMALDSATRQAHSGYVYHAD